MKRFLAILLAFLMLFAVCACDEKKDDKKDGESGEEGTTAYTGSLLQSGDDATLTIDGDVATFESHLVNKGGNSQQDYFINITAPFTKDGDNYVFDFTAEGAKVRVLETDEKWYGVTYREDKDGVVAAIAEKIAAGEYEGI